MNTSSFFFSAALLALSATAAHAALPDEYVLNHNQPAATAVQAAAPRMAERVAPVDEYRRQQFPAADRVQALQRVQVAAEAREARHLGLIAEGEAGAPLASAAQVEQVRQAGVQAVRQHLAAK